MCLQVVNLTSLNTKNKPSAKMGLFRGFKSLEPWYDNKIEKELKDYFNLMDKKVKLGVWYDATNLVLGGDDNRPYTSGFHVFENSQDACEYGCGWDEVYVVEFKDIVAVGRQNSYNKGLTFVAKKMRIVRKAKNGVDYDAPSNTTL